MSDSNDFADATATTVTDGAGSGNGNSGRRRSTGLAGMLLPELKQLAGDLGITGIGQMRKGQLIEAIQAMQSGMGSPVATALRPSPSGASNGSAGRGLRDGEPAIGRHVTPRRRRPPSRPTPRRQPDRQPSGSRRTARPGRPPAPAQ